LASVMKRLRQRNVFWYGLLFMLLFALYQPVVHAKLYELTENQEFGSHALGAQKIMTGQKVPAYTVAHPLLELTEIAVMQLVGVEPFQAAEIVSVLFYLWLGWIVYRQVLQRIQPGAWVAQLLCLALTLALLLVAQIPVLFGVDRELYFGYIGINLYNGPTNNALKPFALLIMVYAFKAFEDHTAKAADLAAAAVLVVLSTLLKPNFIICLLPALCILAFLKWRQRAAVDWRVILAIAVPAGLVLGWQYVINYTKGSSIFFAPFLVMRFYTDAMIIKLLASLAFPLLVTCFYWSQVRRDERLRLAWLSFLFGLFYTYFLAENSAGSYTHGNLYWSGEIMLFVLFVLLALFWLEQVAPKQQLVLYDRTLVYALMAHFLSGIVLYLFSLSVDSYSKLNSFQKLVIGLIR